MMCPRRESDTKSEAGRTTFAKKTHSHCLRALAGEQDISLPLYLYLSHAHCLRAPAGEQDRSHVDLFELRRSSDKSAHRFFFLLGERVVMLR